MKNQTVLLVKSKKKGGEKMKKSLLMIAAVLLFAAPVMAGISTTKHNLGLTGTGTFRTSGNGATSEICIFCHTPHNANLTGPLWNRITSAVSSTYDSPTLNNKVQTGYLSSATAVAPLCLSCHDGATALGAVTYQGDKTITGWTAVMTGSAAIGGALNNDHPVGMTYDPTADQSPYGTPGLRDTISSGTPGPGTGPLASWFRTGSGYTSMMDCSSCHDVHGKDGNKKFLRRSNGTSNFCNTCHNK